MPDATFRLVLTKDIRGRVIEVNGHDITSHVVRVGLISEAATPRLQLELEADFTLEGDGVIEVLAAGDPGESTGNWLANVDAGELKRQALDRLGWGTDDVVAAALDILRELAAKDTT